MSDLAQPTVVPPPRDRVRERTAAPVNERIDRQTRASIQDSVSQGRDAIIRRLAELDHEWDVDRALMANFAVVGGAAFSMGLARYTTTPLLDPPRKGLLYFFGVQMTFLLVHAVAGWCPPAPVFRRLGFRTKGEIEAERHSLLGALEAA
jgi:hypothetical protein